MKLFTLVLILFQIIFAQFFVDVASASVVIDLPTAIESIDSRLSLVSSDQTETIDFTTYHLFYDQAGKTFLASLLYAAKKGVKIRGLIDNKIYKSDPELVDYLIEKGIEIKFYNPIRPSLLHLLNPIQQFKKLNKRLHDKMFIVNSDQLIIGDKNYSNKYYGQLRALDTSTKFVSGKEVFIQGPEIQSYKDYFETLWAQSESVSPANVRLSDSQRFKYDTDFHPFFSWIQKRLKLNLEWKKNIFEFTKIKVVKNTETESALDHILNKISTAPPNSRVLIENGYFVLFPKLRETIIKAQDRNIEITLVTNSAESSDLWTIAQARKIDLNEMLDLGLKIQMNTDRSRATHAKLVLLESPEHIKEVVLFSANIDPRSYNINSESGLILQSPSLHDYYWEKFERTKKTRVLVQKMNSCQMLFQENNVVVNSNSFFRKLLIQKIRSQL